MSIRTSLILSVLFMLILACAAVPAKPSAHHPGAIAGVFTVHDEFTGTVSFESDEFVARERSMANGGTLEAMWTLLAVGGSDTILLHFRAESFDSWDYLNCHDVSVLADGQPVVLPPGEWDGTVGTSASGDRVQVTEYINVELSPANATTIAQADRVQIRYCNSVMEFPRAGGRAIGEMSRRLASSSVN